MGRAIVIVKVICLDLVNVYGKSPIILLMMIIINREIIIIVIPLEFVPINILNSLCNLLIILVNNISVEFGNNQNLMGINIIHVNDLIQLIDILVDVAGSNVENKLVITFSLYY